MTGGHRLVALFGEISCAHFQEHHADERNSGDVARADDAEGWFAFLGSQGDEWDAQKDILCDTFGAVCSGSFFLLLNRNVQIDVRCKCKWVLPKIAPPASFRDFIK